MPTAEEYRAKSQTFNRHASWLFLGAVLPGVVGMALLADVVVGETPFRPVLFSALLPVFCAPFCAWAWAVKRLDRRLNVRCPACAVSLLGRTDPSRVLADGLCPVCRSRVLS